jgi:hypothetical protein
LNNSQHLSNALQLVASQLFTLRTVFFGRLRLFGNSEISAHFEVMFFSDPEAAFTNIRKSLKPGGRLVFICWRSLAENHGCKRRYKRRFHSSRLLHHPIQRPLDLFRLQHPTACVGLDEPYMQAPFRPGGALHRRCASTSRSAPRDRRAPPCGRRRVLLREEINAANEVREQHDPRVRQIPHVIDLEGTAERFLYEAKNFLRDLLQLFRIVYKCELKDASDFTNLKDKGDSNVVKWATATFGTDDDLTKLLKTEQTWCRSHKGQECGRTPRGPFGDTYDKQHSGGPQQPTGFHTTDVAANRLPRKQYTCRYGNRIAQHAYTRRGPTRRPDQA